MFGVDGLKASNPGFHTMGDGSMTKTAKGNYQGQHDSEVNLVNSIGLLMMLCAPHPADRWSDGGPDACLVLVCARRQLFFTVFAIRRREKQDGGGGGGAQVSTIQEGLMAVAPS